MGTFTTAFVRDTKSRSTMYELTCDALPGFILRVLPTGKKVFLVRDRVDATSSRGRPTAHTWRSAATRCCWSTSPPARWTAPRRAP
jgi:hypothetical protein